MLSWLSIAILTLNNLKPNMIFKLLALVLAALGFYLSPYGPGFGQSNGPSASESNQSSKPKAQSGSFYLAKVTRVADGDTLTVRNRDGAIHKIRMHAVDSPELNQAGGQQAKNWLTQQVLNKEVKIVVNNTDRYKRQVAKVVLPVEGCLQRLCEGEVDVNLKAVEAGHAWWYKNFARTQSSEDRVLYEAAEQRARDQRNGLWQQAAPQAPWQWRTEQREQR